tara:strand:- start:271 stop:726 length:456 start_codon:yes stop_codon:yes gene_type:complete
MPTAIKSDKINLSSEIQTKKLASKISSKLKKKDILFLQGEMGVGKTTFVKYLINAMQKKNNLNLTEITSPTFNILNEYKVKQMKINHYDLYRLNSEDELKNLDLFSDLTNTITLVEWPEIINTKPKNLIELEFSYDENYKNRSVLIKGLNL